MPFAFTTDLDEREIGEGIHEGGCVPENEDKVDDDEQQPWLSENEFVQKYRMSKRNSKAILEMIKDHPVFQNGHKRQQAPPAHQLLVFLKYVGTEGAGASNGNQRSTFGIGYGTASLYREQVTKALWSLSNEYI